MHACGRLPGQITCTCSAGSTGSVPFFVKEASGRSGLVGAKCDSSRTSTETAGQPWEGHAPLDTLHSSCGRHLYAPACLVYVAHGLLVAADLAGGSPCRLLLKLLFKLFLLFNGFVAWLRDVFAEAHAMVSCNVVAAHISAHTPASRVCKHETNRHHRTDTIASLGLDP